MDNVTGHPLLVFLIVLIAQALSARIGHTFLRRLRPMDDDDREDFDVVRSATLTLLGLLIGFTFSMSIGRYDQRKNLEEAEANAIGTEYLRAGLLPAADAARVRALLVSYTEQRILFYTTRDDEKLASIDTRTAQLQAELWSAAEAAAVARPSPLAAVAAMGMNDALNAQGYTQAAWWNRIPTAAWTLMLVMAICANVLLGYGLKGGQRGSVMLVTFPLIISVAFLLIADIDSPRRGFIRVVPQNLISLSESLRAQ